MKKILVAVFLCVVGIVVGYNFIYGHDQVSKDSKIELAEKKELVQPLRERCGEFFCDDLPYCMNYICETSRGETVVNCPADCDPHAMRLDPVIVIPDEPFCLGLAAYRYSFESYDVRIQVFSSPESVSFLEKQILTNGGKENVYRDRNHQAYTKWCGLKPGHYRFTWQDLHGAYADYTSPSNLSQLSLSAKQWLKRDQALDGYHVAFTVSEVGDVLPAGDSCVEVDKNYTINGVDGSCLKFDGKGALVPCEPASSKK